MEKNKGFANQVFERLQAEHEADWLGQVYVAPSNFSPSYWGAQPLAVVSESGGGKTALRVAMMERVNEVAFEKTHLVVDWRFSLPVSEPLDNQGVHVFVTEIMDACMQALLRYLLANTSAFQAASHSVQDIIVALLQQYLSGPIDFHIDQAKVDLAINDTIYLEEKLTSQLAYKPLDDYTPLPAVIKNLGWATGKIGVGRFYIFIDGLEFALDLQKEDVERMLKGMFASLAIFEEAGFVLKLFAPSSLLSLIKASSAAQRRRIEAMDLQFHEAELLEMVNRRLSYAFSRQMQVKDVDCSGLLLQWLQQYGGNNPRGWLRLIRPFATAYADAGEALTEDRCREVFFQHLPQIRVDCEEQKVFCGYSEILDLSPTFYDLLAYLYENRDRICTKSELFYFGLRKLKDYPDLQSQDWEYPDRVSGRIDTELGRLRIAIEHNPKDPVYLKTYRGRGIKLENAL